MFGIGKSFTYSGLDANTKYDLNVTCSKENSVDKHGNLEHTTGKNNEITFLNECTADSVPVTITYNDGKNYFFKLTSSGSIDSKYKTKECTKIDSDSCNSDVITYVKSNTWYMVNSNNIIVKMNNNGTIYVYSSDNSSDIKFSSSLTSTVTLIDKSIPNVPTLITSDSITSGNWHKSNYDINLSNGESKNVNSKCKGVTYQVSTDNVNFNDMTGTSKKISTEEKSKAYYFRTMSKNKKVSTSIEYISSLDKTKPKCIFKGIKDFRNSKSIDVTMTCTDNLSGIVKKNLSSKNFSTSSNIKISSVKLNDNNSYTITITATATGSDSYIKIKKDTVFDNAGNSNAAKKSSTFTILPNTYTIKFNSNGGSGTMSNIQLSYGNASNLTSNSFKKQYIVTYDYNGATGGNSQSSTTSSYNFVGWTMGGPNLYSKLNLSNTHFSVSNDGMYYLNRNNTSTSTQYVNFFFDTRNDIVSGNDYTEIAVIKSLNYSGNMNYYVGDTPSASGTITQVSGGNSSVSNLKIGNNYFSLKGTSINGPILLSRGFISISAGSSLNIKFRPVLIASKYNNIDMYYYDKGSINVTTSVDDDVVTLYADWNEMPVTLPTPTKTGYTFAGWYTSASGGTKIGDGGTSYIPTSNIKLYARWNAKTYTIKYDANGGTGSMSDTIVTYGKNTTISSNNFGKNGYTFAGWITRTNGKDDADYGWTGWSGTWVYDNGQYGISNNTLKLYARWSENTENINKYWCSGSDLYYITTCGLGTKKCNYTYKNDSSETGTISKSNLNDNLTSCSNYQVNNGDIYTKTLKRSLELVSSSNTIKILNDNTDSSSATVSKNVTIDTNGKTVTRTSAIDVNSNYKLTMKGTGKIYSEEFRIFNVYGTLEIQGGTYESNHDNISTIYLPESPAKLILNDINYIAIKNKSGSGSVAIKSVSTEDLDINAKTSDIYIYGAQNGIYAPNATVSVSSKYTTENAIGVYNYISANFGAAIYAKNIKFGTEYDKQTEKLAYYPQARSYNYTAASSREPVLKTNGGNINFYSGDIYSDFKAGTYQSDWDKPAYSGPGDTYKSVDIGNLITNKKVISPSGYTVKYFTSSSATGNVVALRIVKN